MRARDLFAPALVFGMLLPMSVQAQQPDEEIRLVFDREVYLYGQDGRRDPFVPLIGEGIGPRFEDLSLAGIIFSEDPQTSMAVINGPGGKVYRLRRGDSLGNVRVLEIRPLQVVFAVENYGVLRQEMLELKKDKQGAGS